MLEKNYLTWGTIKRFCINYINCTDSSIKHFPCMAWNSLVSSFVASAYCSSVEPLPIEINLAGYVSRSNLGSVMFLAHQKSIKHDPCAQIDLHACHFLSLLVNMTNLLFWDTFFIQWHRAVHEDSLATSQAVICWQEEAQERWNIPRMCRLFVENATCAHDLLTNRRRSHERRNGSCTKN